MPSWPSDASARGAADHEPATRAPLPAKEDWDTCAKLRRERIYYLVAGDGRVDLAEAVTAMGTRLGVRYFTLLIVDVFNLH